MQYRYTQKVVNPHISSKESVKKGYVWTLCVLTVFVAFCREIFKKSPALQAKYRAFWLVKKR